MTPKDHSTAGKVRLGAITKAGDEALRSVLVAGATSMIQQVRKGPRTSLAWLLHSSNASRPSSPPWRSPTDGAHHLEADGQRRALQPAARATTLRSPTDSLAPGTRRQGQAACGGDLRSALTRLPYALPARRHRRKRSYRPHSTSDGAQHDSPAD